MNTSYKCAADISWIGKFKVDFWDLKKACNFRRLVVKYLSSFASNKTILLVLGSQPLAVARHSFWSHADVRQSCRCQAVVQMSGRSQTAIIWQLSSQQTFCTSYFVRPLTRLKVWRLWSFVLKSETFLLWKKLSTWKEYYFFGESVTKNHEIWIILEFGGFHPQNNWLDSRSRL